MTVSHDIGKRKHPHAVYTMGLYIVRLTITTESSTVSAFALQEVVCPMETPTTSWASSTNCPRMPVTLREMIGEAFKSPDRPISDEHGHLDSKSTTLVIQAICFSNCVMMYVLKLPRSSH